jgi:hypothetical protein
MVAVYNTFGEAEAARPAGQYKKYAAAVAGAWAVLFVAAVLVIGAQHESSTGLLQIGRPQMLAFKEFVPETNWVEESGFDADFAPAPWAEYDPTKEADWAQLNIASGVEGSEVTEGIADPYADQSPRVEVPAAVYTQPPPYDPSVVEIGEKVFGEAFHEYTHAEEGEAVMGKEYEDVPFSKTLESVPEANPSREWEILDTQNSPYGY